MRKEHLESAKTLIAETSVALRKLAECSFPVKSQCETANTPVYTVDLETLRKMASE